MWVGQGRVILNAAGFICLLCPEALKDALGAVDLKEEGCKSLKNALGAVLQGYSLAPVSFLCMTFFPVSFLCMTIFSLYA